MERIQGKELSDYLGKLTAKEYTKIAEQLIHGLDCIHKSGNLHKDIKPNNIMIEYKNGELNAKFIDFGLGCDLNDIARGLKCELGGTMFYLPPEMFEMLEMSKKGRRKDIAGVIQTK